MQNYVIPEFSTDNFSIILPSEMVYIEIYDKDFNYILDSNKAVIINNVLYIYRENYQSSDFPLNVLAFSSEDGEQAIPLFNQRLGMPTSNTRIAIGKRNELAKNINVREFADYVNEGGSIYITKDFSGFDYNIGRENLDIYSKNVVRNATRNIITQSSYTYTSQQFYFRPWMNTRNPFSSGQGYDFKQIRFTTTFKNGFIDVNTDFIARAYYIRENGGYRVCSISEAIGQNWSPEQPVIVAPEVEGLPIEIRKYGDGQTNQSIQIYSNYDFPFLIFTGTPYTINGKTLQGDSVYTFYQQKASTGVTVNRMTDVAFSAFPTDKRIRYRVHYAVNDAQLT